jgi:hypothetical protein
LQLFVLRGKRCEEEEEDWNDGMALMYEDRDE